MSTARRILIVGGGIGGLTLAALLKRSGLYPVLVEKAPAWKPLGAGIVLAPNALSILDVFGASREVRARGHSVLAVEITDENGVILQRLDTRYSRTRLPPIVAVHRADLHQALLESCAGIDLRLGTSVESLRDDGSVVRARLTDGSEGDFDLVVGADGIHSTVRELVLGHIEPRYAGYAAWRMVLDGVDGFRRSLEMWGSGRRFGAVPIGQGRIYCWAALDVPRHMPDPPEGRIERLRSRFGEFGHPAQGLLTRLTDPEQLLRDDIEELDSGRMAVGRVALLGDAAHAMTPNLGQGAGMAIEDAWILTRRLADHASVEEALGAYEAQRLRRVRLIRNLSRLFGQVGHWHSPLATAARAALLRATPDRVAMRRYEKLLLGMPELPITLARESRHAS